MDRPLVLIADEAAALFAGSPAGRALMNELLLTGRKNGIQEQTEPGLRRALPYGQYPTLAELEAAARPQ